MIQIKLIRPKLKSVVTFFGSSKGHPLQYMSYTIESPVIKKMSPTKNNKKFLQILWSYQTNTAITVFRLIRCFFRKTSMMQISYDAFIGHNIYCNNSNVQRRNSTRYMSYAARSARSGPARQHDMPYNCIYRYASRSCAP